MEKKYQIAREAFRSFLGEEVIQGRTVETVGGQKYEALWYYLYNCSSGKLYFSLCREGRESEVPEHPEVPETLELTVDEIVGLAWDTSERPAHIYAEGPVAKEMYHREYNSFRGQVLARLPAGLGIDPQKDFAEAELCWLQEQGFSSTAAIRMVKAAGPAQVRDSVVWAWDALEFLADRGAQSRRGVVDALDCFLGNLGGTHSFGRDRLLAALQAFGLPEVPPGNSSRTFSILRGAHVAITEGLLT